MKEIAKILLDIEAVSLSPKKPFTWASGIKSPIYCDNRLILSYPEQREIVEDAMVKLIREKFPEVEYIMATATAGIPHGAIIAQKMNLPMGFVRTSKKDHGKNNQIEGKLIKGAKVVVIEDLFSTGGSSIDVAKALMEAGYKVMGIVSIFTYNLKKAEENFKSNNIDHYSLANFDELAEVAAEHNYIEVSEIEKIKKWKLDPYNEDWMK
ncbi:orotate phosphoribosyltransferase [Peptoniphilus catoniae]|uniref:orotate phosphoribosyltransferase n=1 Tax=Peptoniphilus catoniae TaxID=1660341 RepID=UPI0010FD6ADE|nr:orotate phosphoribosyltransferase [Peptoniphilus catoniae]